MVKKLLFLTSRLPYPTTSGRKNVMFYYCKYLHEMYGYEIINVSFLEEGDDLKLKPEFISKSYPLKSVSKVSKAKNLFIDTVIKNKKPLQVSLYYSKQIENQIKQIIDLEKPDLLMCDMVRTAEYIKGYDIPKILDMDDLLSKRYERQVNIDIKNINPYGAFLYTLPNPIQNIISNKLIKKFILNKEVKLLKKYEQNISKYYNSIVFVAQSEADELNKRINSDKAFAVPLGVDINYFKDYKEKIDKEKNSISFMGALSVAHNETGILHFCENIFPKIKEELKDIKLYIIGGSITDKIKNIAQKDDNIILTGRVEDTRPYIKNTEIFICPLLFGSGIKTKNLEAMAMGIPVVTTNIGAESIGAIDGKYWIVEDSDEIFAEQIINVLKDQTLKDSLSLNGLSFVENNFSWENTMKTWINVFEYLGI